MNHSKLLSTKNWQNSLAFLHPALIALRTQVLSGRFIRKSIAISLIYLIASNIINSFAIYSNIFSQNFPFLLKIKITLLMFWGNFTLFGEINTFVITVTALLVGMNIMLVTKKLAIVRSQKNAHWTFGAGIVTLVSSSCPGCGFSLLSVTGLTAAIPGLPFHGLEFSLLTLGIISLTSVYNLRTLGIQSCSLP